MSDFFFIKHLVQYSKHYINVQVHKTIKRGNFIKLAKEKVNIFIAFTAVLQFEDDKKKK